MNTEFLLAAQVVRNKAQSALPNAPVVHPHKVRARWNINAIRAATAIALRRTADRLEVPAVSTS